MEAPKVPSSRRLNRSSSHRDNHRSTSGQIGGVGQMQRFQNPEKKEKVVGDQQGRFFGTSRPIGRLRTFHHAQSSENGRWYCGTFFLVYSDEEV